MNTNDYLNGIARSEDEKRLLARIQDLFARASRGTVQSDFLDLRQQDLARAAAVNEAGYAWRFEGGYEEAERKRLIICPDWEQQPASRIACLCIRHKEFRDTVLGHRDYMGAILNLGIKRERLGDIVVQDAVAYVFLDADLCDYLNRQLLRVKNVNVWLEPVQPEDFVYRSKPLKTITISLASLRLDAAVAGAYNLSRADVDELIQAGTVKVNQVEVYKSAAQLKPGDLVSVRGKGRFRIETLGGMTRKNRFWVEIGIW